MLHLEVKYLRNVLISVFLVPTIRIQYYCHIIMYYTTTMCCINLHISYFMSLKQTYFSLICVLRTLSFSVIPKLAGFYPDYVPLFCRLCLCICTIALQCMVAAVLHMHDTEDTHNCGTSMPPLQMAMSGLSQEKHCSPKNLIQVDKLWLKTVIGSECDQLMLISECLIILMEVPVHFYT